MRMQGIKCVVEMFSTQTKVVNLSHRRFEQKIESDLDQTINWTCHGSRQRRSWLQRQSDICHDQMLSITSKILFEKHKTSKKASIVKKCE